MDPNAILEAVKKRKPTLNAVDKQAVETFQALVQQLNDAQEVVNRFGSVTISESGVPMENAASRVVRAASKELRGWLTTREDLFGSQPGQEQSIERYEPLHAIDGL